jgi:hypothetical protein
VLATLQKQGLDDSGLSTEWGCLGVVAMNVFVSNPPIGHFRSLLLGNATIAPFNNPAKSIAELAAKGPRGRDPRAC